MKDLEQFKRKIATTTTPSKEDKTKWQPKQSLVSAIREQTLNYYKENSVVNFLGDRGEQTLPPIIEKLIRVAAFLKDPEQTIKQLVKLNGLLVKKAQLLGIIEVNSNGNPILAAYRKNEPYRPHRKLLRNLLEAELEKFGFQPEFVKVTGILSPTVFRELLRNKLILKDSGVDISHGEFTHAIQWLMIAWQHEETGFLADDDNLNDLAIVSDIYKAFGEENTVYQRTDFNMPSIVNNYSESALWDNFLDLSSSKPQNFTCPERLNKFLLKTDSEDLAFLRSLIESRFTKRDKPDLIEFKTDEKYKESYPNKQYTGSSLPFTLFPNKIHDDLKHLSIQEKKQITVNSELGSEYKGKVMACLYSKPFELFPYKNDKSDAILEIITQAQKHLELKPNKKLDYSAIKAGLDYSYQVRDLLLKTEKQDPVLLKAIYYAISHILYSHLGRVNEAEANILEALKYDKLCGKESSSEKFLKLHLGLYQHAQRYYEKSQDQIPSAMP